MLDSSFRLLPDQCQFTQSELQYMGMILNKDTIKQAFCGRKCKTSDNS